MFNWRDTRLVSLALLLILPLTSILTWMFTLERISPKLGIIAILIALTIWHQCGVLAAILENHDGHGRRYKMSKITVTLGPLGLLWVLLRGLWYGCFVY